MSEYKHRLTLVVPETLLTPANHLALIMGESPYDINTFTTASWQDGEGNKYGVCSAVSKPIVLNALTKGLPNPVPAHAVDADYTLAQQALDMLVVYEDGVLASADKIVLAVDLPPLSVFKELGLLPIESSNEL